MLLPETCYLLSCRDIDQSIRRMIVWIRRELGFHRSLLGTINFLECSKDFIVGILKFFFS